MSQQDRQYFVRQAEVDDVRDLTTMVNSSGGLNFYKAIFGTFHLPSMIDLSYLSLISESMEDRGWGQSGEDQVKEVQGFVVLNDQIPAINDDQGFEFTIKILTDYIPVSVSHFLIYQIDDDNDTKNI